MWYKEPYKEKRNLYIVLIAIFLSLIYVLYFTPNKPTSSEYEYKSRINILKAKSDSLQKTNKYLVNKIDVLNLQVIDLDKSILLQDEKIITLKKQTNEKINNVDSFSDDELNMFFTNRYGQYLDSIKKTSSKISN